MGVGAGFRQPDDGEQALVRISHNLKIIGKLDYDYPISVAVRRDQPDLLSLMELAIQSVTEAERTAIAAKWQRFTVVEEVNYTKLLKLGGAVLVVLGISWFWIVRLQREIARRRKAEAQLLHLASHDPRRMEFECLLAACRFGSWSSVCLSLRRVAAGAARQGLVWFKVLGWRDALWGIGR